MILNEYNSIIREYFDFSDRQTTKFIKYINESDQQSQLLSALASALYEKIVTESDKIDFGSIPRSRGDITKVDGYNNTVECVNIIRRIVTEYKEDTSIIDIELTAIDNMKSLRPIFIKAFNNNASFAMMYYNIITATIQHSVSFLIAVAIQFVKDPNNKNIHMALDKAAYKDAESNVMLEQLAKMNKSYASGELEKILRESVSGIREAVEDDEFTEDTISTTDGVLDAMEDAPTSEDTPIGDEELDEDVTILKFAAGEDIEEPTEEPVNAPSPFSDEQPDQLAAGANNPDTNDDEVEPTPVMPINGGCEATGTESVDEKGCSGSVVKRSYHKHPSANAGYGATNEGIMSTVLQATKANVDKIVNSNTATKIAGSAKFILGKSAKILGIGAGIVIGVLLVIQALRLLIKFLYYLRADLSESLEAQANLIEINSIELQNDENSNLSEDKKTKVIEKQLKIAQKLRAWSQKLAIKDKKADKDAKKDIEDEKKKKISDIKDNLSDDTINDSDLF